MAEPTGVNGCNGTLHNHNRQIGDSCHGTNDLADGGQLGNHVQEERHQSHEAQEQAARDAITLPRPFSQNEAFRAPPPDNGTESSKCKQRQRRRQGVDDDSLDTSNGGEFGIREENCRTED